MIDDRNTAEGRNYERGSLKTRGGGGERSALLPSKYPFSIPLSASIGSNETELNEEGKKNLYTSGRHVVRFRADRIFCGISIPG